jgi:hypothetical protein
LSHFTEGEKIVEADDQGAFSVEIVLWWEIKLKLPRSRVTKRQT